MYGGFVLDPSALSLFRILPFESVSSRPYRSFSCRFLWLPRRCVFDGFLQDFEAFKGYVRPPVGPSVFGWLGLNPAGVSLFRMHRPLHVLGALKFKVEAATEAAIPSPSTTWFCMFLERFPDAEAAIPSPSTTWFCMFLERFPEGAFSMASYRILRRSKGTLSLCRAVCLWLVGLESCWGFLVSHASSTPWFAVPHFIPASQPRPFQGFTLLVFLAVLTQSFGAPSAGKLASPLGIEACWDFPVSHASATAWFAVQGQ